MRPTVVALKKPNPILNKKVMKKFKTIKIKIIDPSILSSKEFVDFMDISYREKESFLFFDAKEKKYSMTYFDENESYPDRYPQLLFGKKRAK